MHTMQRGGQPPSTSVFLYLQTGEDFLGVKERKGNKGSEQQRTLPQGTAQRDSPWGKDWGRSGDEKQLLASWGLHSSTWGSFQPSEWPSAYHNQRGLPLQSRFPISQSSVILKIKKVFLATAPPLPCPSLLIPLLPNLQPAQRPTSGPAPGQGETAPRE